MPKPAARLGSITSIGPIAAAIAPAAIMKLRLLLSIFANEAAARSTKPTSFSIVGASALPILICAPSTAERIRASAPLAVSSIISAIALAAPSLAANSPVSFLVSSPLFPSTSSAVCAARPTSSFALARFRPSAASPAIAPPTSPPVAPRSEIIRFSAVPAWLPFIPAFERLASIAVVSSRLIPALWATGATNFIDSAKLSISKAEAPKLLAITSVTRCVSLASSPKPRSVLPATSAARARSASAACAKASVLSVTWFISPLVKPKRAKLSCKPATSVAVNFVLLPNRKASLSSAANSEAVAPLTAFTFAIPDSKSAAT